MTLWGAEPRPLPFDSPRTLAVQLFSCGLCPDPHSLWPRACVLGCWRRQPGVISVLAVFVG